LEKVPVVAPPGSRHLLVALTEKASGTISPGVALGCAQPALLLQEVEEDNLAQQLLGETADRLIRLFVAALLELGLLSEMFGELLEQRLVLVEELVGDFLDGEGRLDLLDFRVGVVHLQDRQQLSAGGVAVFVFADQKGVAPRRGQLLLEFYLALLVHVGLVFDLDEGEAPVRPMIILGVEGDQRGLFLELLEAVDGKVAQGRAGALQLGEGFDLHHQQIELVAVGVDILADAPILIEVLFEGVGDVAARVVPVALYVTVKQVPDEMPVVLQIEGLGEKLLDQLPCLFLFHALLAPRGNLVTG